MSINLELKRARSRKYYHAHKDSCKESAKRFRDKNPDYHKNYNLVNKEELREGRRASDKRREERSRPLRNTRESFRRASRRHATPSWLTETQKQEIYYKYELAKELEALTGDKYHVDHIVPLTNKNVCGLHVPWNLQVLPADLNMKKGNKFAR